MTSTRPFAVSEAGAVEGDGAVSVCRLIKDAADQQIFDHRAVAMEKYDRAAAAFCNVVEANTAGGDELTARGIGTLGLAGLSLNKGGGAGQCHTCQHKHTAAPCAPR
jgi:hypothetical protein